MQQEKKETHPKPRRVASLRFPSGDMIETIYSPDEGKTHFAMSRDDIQAIGPSYAAGSGELFEPIPGSNNLIRYGAVTLAAAPEDYGSVPELALAIQSYIYRYVDLSDHFRKIASYYLHSRPAVENHRGSCNFHINVGAI